VANFFLTIFLSLWAVCTGTVGVENFFLGDENNIFKLKLSSIKTVGATAL